jgi:hypothetical protein
MNKILPIILSLVILGCGGTTEPPSLEYYADDKYLYDEETNSWKYVEACEKDGNRYIYESKPTKGMPYGRKFHKIDGEEKFLKEDDKIVYEDYRGDKYFAVDCERTEFTNSIKCKNKYLNEQELKDASEQALKETEDMNKNNALIMKCADKALKDFTTSFCANRLEDKLQIPAYAKAYEKGTRIRDLSLYDDGEEFDYIWTVEYKQHHKCIKNK